MNRVILFNFKFLGDFAHLLILIQRQHLTEWVRGVFVLAIKLSSALYT